MSYPYGFQPGMPGVPPPAYVPTTGVPIAPVAGVPVPVPTPVAYPYPYPQPVYYPQQPVVVIDEHCHGGYYGHGGFFGHLFGGHHHHHHC